MINDRPAHLLDQDNYRQLPASPFGVQFDVIPELIGQSLGPLGGIQPVTRAMATAAEGPLLNLPSDGEIDLFRNAGTKFQMVSGCRQGGAFQNARQRAP